VVYVKKPFVITVAATSGGGKTTIVGVLKKRLANSAVLYFDDYGEEVDLPPGRDINEWAAEGGDHNEWNTAPIAADIERLLHEPYDYIILDYPFGYLNDCVGKYIDLSVFIDTPLDVALARRIIRDFTSRSTESDFGLDDVGEVNLESLDEYLRWYLEHSRPTYVWGIEIFKKDADLVMDGTKSPDEIVDKILEAL